MAAGRVTTSPLPARSSSMPTVASVRSPAAVASVVLGTAAAVRTTRERLTIDNDAVLARTEHGHRVLAGNESRRLFELGKLDELPAVVTMHAPLAQIGDRAERGDDDCQKVGNAHRAAPIETRH